MERRDLAKAAHHALTDILRQLGRDPAATVDETDARLLVAGNPSAGGPLANVAVRIAHERNPAQVVADAEYFFRVHDRRFALWAMESEDEDLRQAASAAGLRLGTTGIPVMATTVTPSAKPLPHGMEVQEVGDVETAAELASVAGQAFAGTDHPPAATEALLRDPAVMLDAAVYGILIRRDEVAVSCGLALIGVHGAGIHFVGTVPPARRLGLGEAVVRLVTAAAFRRGADVATLQAAAGAQAIYSRVGFKTVAAYTTMIGPA